MIKELSSDEIERLWIEEAQRRDDAIEAGDLTERPADEVLRDARARLKKNESVE